METTQKETSQEQQTKAEETQQSGWDKAVNTILGNNTLLDKVFALLLAPGSLMVGVGMWLYWHQRANTHKREAEKLQEANERLAEENEALTKKAKKLKKKFQELEQSCRPMLEEYRARQPHQLGAHSTELKTIYLD